MPWGDCFVSETAIFLDKIAVLTSQIKKGLSVR